MFYSNRAIYIRKNSNFAEDKTYVGPIVMKRYVDISECDTCNNLFPCVKDCVTSFLQITETGGRSFASFKERGYCLDCGHCNAICPTGAIKGFQWEENNDFLSFLAKKRTVREYNNKNQINKEQLFLIEKAAQSAPTEKNRGTVSVIFVKDDLKQLFLDALEILVKNVREVGVMHPQYKYLTQLYEKKEPVFWGAEYAVLVIGKPQYIVDAAICAERMQMMASSLGVSSGYNGNLKSAINDSGELKDRLGLKNGEQVLVSFAMGNSDVKYSHPYISFKKKILYR